MSDADSAEPASNAAVEPHVFSMHLLSAATAIVCIEILTAYLSRLPLLPFIGCAIAFLLLIVVFASQRMSSSVSGSRLLIVALLLKLLAVFVGITGGIGSSYIGILFLPIFLGALYFGALGGTLVGTIVAAVLSVQTMWHGDWSRANVLPLLIQDGVFLVVAVGAGAFADQMRRTAVKATRRASVNGARANKLQWFSDTAVMMESLDDPDNMLTVALLRLEDLVTFDVAAVYVRDADENYLSLTQVVGLNSDNVGIRSIPIDRTPWMNVPALEDAGLLCVDSNSPAAGIFAEIYPEAQSLLIVPLRTLEALVGIIYIGSQRQHAFREKDGDNVSQFARHIVFPVQRARLRTLATTDALTGLNNRLAFRQRLQAEVERAGRYGSSLSLIMIDIDHFKKVNDTRGHRAGDAILTQVGAILRYMIRATDFAARYGGEEMALICPETTGSDAHALGERIRCAVEKAAFHLPDSEMTIPITISAGAATLSKTGGSGAALIEAADGALYAAKAGGRNAVLLSDDTTIIGSAKVYHTIEKR